MSKICYQINFSENLGGAEVYAHFFTLALLQMGWRTTIFVNRKAGFWNTMDFSGASISPVDKLEDILSLIPEQNALLVTHTPVKGQFASTLTKKYFLIGFAHDAVYGNCPETYRRCHLLFPVSKYVISTLKSVGIEHYFPEPLYGVANTDRLRTKNTSLLIERPLFDWDRRKLRDRTLSLVYPLYQRLKPSHAFTKKEGVTLGIVSRVAGIKQFPLLFECLNPIFAKFPQVNIEIFGSGTYSLVRNLKRSLAPIKHQVRFWGKQNNVSAIYPQLDYLMTGLPEREALGLNVIEAEYCGTPVLAVNAPPFTETVIEGKTGYLYNDPRLDNGQDFERLLRQITASPVRPNPAAETAHLALFTQQAFTQRVGAALNYALDNAQRLQQVNPREEL